MNAFKCFKRIFSDVVDIHTPLKEHRVKNIEQPIGCHNNNNLQSIDTGYYYKKHGDEAFAKY